jgi:hypothetical protein
MVTPTKNKSKQRSIIRSPGKQTIQPKLSTEESFSNFLDPEQERMKTSIMILNKQLLIKDEEFAETKNELIARIRDLENTNHV